jgi:hypothetical protein
VGIKCKVNYPAVSYDLNPCEIKIMNISLINHKAAISHELIATHGKYLQLHPEDGGSMVLRNVGVLLPQHYTVSRPR